MFSTCFFSKNIKCKLSKIFCDLIFVFLIFIVQYNILLPCTNGGLTANRQPISLLKILKNLKKLQLKSKHTQALPVTHTRARSRYIHTQTHTLTHTHNIHTLYKDRNTNFIMNINM